MNTELTSITLDEYVDNFQQNENPDSLTDVVQNGGFIRAPSVTPDMVDNQDNLLEEPGALLQNGGCACASGKIRSSEYESVQYGGDVASVDTNALFQQYLDENQSEASVQSGGNVASVDTNALFNTFLGDNQSEVSIQSGGDDSLYSSIASDLMSTGTIDLFSNFVNKYKFKNQMQTGGGNKKQSNDGGNNKVMSLKKAVDLLNEVYKE